MGATAAPPPYDHTKHRERFARVASHPEFPAAQAWTPRWSVLDAISSPLSLMIFSVLASVGSCHEGLASAPDFGSLMALFLAIFVIGAVWMVSAVIYVRQPIQRVVAVVINDREKKYPWFSRPDSDQARRYRVTLGFANGDRQVLATTGKISAAIDRDDIGVGYRKGRRLIDFRRFPV